MSESNEQRGKETDRLNTARSIEISLIAAVADNGVIGDGKGRAWYLPGDLMHFRALTLGKPIIMGTVTWTIIGHPLPDRPNIVLSHDLSFNANGAHVVNSLRGAYDLAESLAKSTGAHEAMVIGGGQVYSQTIGDCVRIYLTHVKASPHGNVRFPTLDLNEWDEIERPRVTPDPRDSHVYTFVTLQRRHRAV